MSDRITIYEALRRMQEAPDQGFEVQYVRANGRLKGSIKTVVLQHRDVRTLRRKAGNAQRYLMRDKWVLKAYNPTAGRIETPLVSHILKFDGKIVEH